MKKVLFTMVIMFLFALISCHSGSSKTEKNAIDSTTITAPDSLSVDSVSINAGQISDTTVVK